LWTVGFDASSAAGYSIRVPIGENACDEPDVDASMSVTRIAWLVTTCALLLTALLLLLAGYRGYAGLGLAVAASAAINLR
jgi:hypothetical protein